MKRAGVLSLALLSGAAALLTPGSAQAQAQAQERRQPRVIAPELVAPPPIDSTGLERAQPRSPLSELAGPAPEPKPQDTLYYRPVAIAAGMFESEGRTITIAGIRVIGADQSCDASSGGAWLCGKRARTAFRYWLRGRALECHAEGGAANEAASDNVSDAPMRCSLAGYDVGSWLVENGWALASPDGPYAEEAKAARNAGKGIFSGGPSGS
ncbi:thermonuclease family protein [uncultured Nitratireductor sp.]|uniref:thermonuclease family protein n=1 Tax=uncultured Nitratireductor sp. TaxID=520953 RepID=UPI002630DC32|nr:thermonuclease family protein [uncultured Nitratireductor sp.]